MPKLKQCLHSYWSYVKEIQLRCSIYHNSKISTDIILCLVQKASLSFYKLSEDNYCLLQTRLFLDTDETVLSNNTLKEPEIINFYKKTETSDTAL